MNLLKNIKSFLLFQRIACNNYKSYPFIIGTVILCNAIRPFILVIFPRYILDEAFGNKNINRLIYYLLAMSLSTVIIGIVQSFFTNRLHFLSMKLKSQLRMDMSYKTTKLKFEYLENAEILDMKQQANKFLEEDVDRAIYITPNLMACILSTLGYIYIISSLNFIIVVIMLFIILFNSLVQNNVEKYAYSYRTELAPVERKIAYFIMTTPNQKYGKDIRLYNLSDWLYKKYKKQAEITYDAYKKVFNKRTSGAILTTIANLVQTVCIYSWLIYQVFRNRLTVGEFTMYFNAISNFSENVIGIFSNWVQMANLKRGLEDYINFMNLEVEDSEDLQKLDVTAPSIEFCNVWFQYPNQDNYILKDISIKIPYGKKVSIVGENGAGKTTFIKLLTRLYEPTKGKILINGIDITKINIQDYRKYFAVVFQDFNIFSFKIQENIALSDSDSDTSINRVREAIEVVGLRDKVDSLEDGIDTYIETIFSPKGIQLSGGQSQKVAIARALYHDSPILVLDEPTAALDPRAEYEIYKSFHNISKNKTTFFVSHRLSSTRFSDIILVFDNGEIVEVGNHAELIEHHKLYCELYNMQSQFYENV